MSVPKYVIVNGVMMLNPSYGATKETAEASVISNTNSNVIAPLAVISSIQDIGEAGGAQFEATGLPLQVSNSTSQSIEVFQSTDYTNKFNSSVALDGAALLEQLSNLFAEYEVPVGMLAKLLLLESYRLDFIIDDSGSMIGKTDTELKEAATIMLTRPPREHEMMSRWIEAENRLHNMLDMIAYVPTKEITISFLNSDLVIVLTRDGKSPENFRVEAHLAIRTAFLTVKPRGQTPILTKLKKAMERSAQFPEPMIHYLFTDGEPSDSTKEQVASFVKERENPEKNPLTFISCTNKDEETVWMKNVEEVALFCSEVDDYHDEMREVIYDQGHALPYTKGLWLICQLTSAICPDDLDALDENLPFTKYTLDNVLGRVLSCYDYMYYFENNPHAAMYVEDYPKFVTDSVHAREIISPEEQKKREDKAGYKNGVRPHEVMPSIAHLMEVYKAPPPSY